MLMRAEGLPLPEIRPIKAQEMDEAIFVIATGVQSIYGRGEPTPEQIAKVRENLLHTGSLEDLQDVAEHYGRNGGLFLVLIDSEKVVGTGSLKKLDPATSELGRLWFLPAYRGRGLGRRIAEQLLDFARQTGYERVVLDT